MKFMVVSLWYMRSKTKSDESLNSCLTTPIIDLPLLFFSLELAWLLFLVHVGVCNEGIETVRNQTKTKVEHLVKAEQKNPVFLITVTIKLQSNMSVTTFFKR